MPSKFNALLLCARQDDYRQAVIELDEKEFTSLRLCCCELRNHYVRKCFIACNSVTGQWFCFQGNDTNSCCRHGSAKAPILTLNFNRSFRPHWNFCIFFWKIPLENGICQYLFYKNYPSVKAYKQHKLLTLLRNGIQALKICIVLSAFIPFCLLKSEQ